MQKVFTWQNMIWRWVKVRLSTTRKGAGRPSGGNQLIGIAQCAKAGGRGEREVSGARGGARGQSRAPRPALPPLLRGFASPRAASRASRLQRGHWKHAPDPNRAYCGSCQCWSCDICTNPRTCSCSRSLPFFHARTSLRRYERRSRTWYMYKNAWYVNSRDERERT